MATLAHSIRRNAIGLGLFAIITGGTIALTQALTQDRIEQQIARAEAEALFDIIPEDRHDNQLLRDTVTLPATTALNDGEPLTAWVARRGDRPFGLIVPVTAPGGYSGDIRLLIGLNMKGTVLGVRVTSHRETPGLGDKIETKKSDWIYTFEGQSLDNPEPENWAVKKDGGAFDQFTGATITPRAVVDTVRDTLIYFRENRKQIRDTLRQPASPEDEPVTPGSLAGGDSAQEHS
ncbi:electron transport complex subunit RsxG [Marinobacter confluentis]|uniref:Ion-translocating oxidoreductase complex subunit G n=1 Tax=Marinobacter confluentis TaxID=1697557 RepID=A0A4Z1CJP2_9GAMM|nr:electron transport complex subunit RsxG [Marinobacter confluentis]TGN41952.1 electron transport complex subunit RsxG [Marinobacter confluentis]